MQTCLSLTGTRQVQTTSLCLAIPQARAPALLGHNHYKVSDSMNDGNCSTLDLGFTLHPGCWLHDLHHAPPPEAPAPAWPLPLHHLQEA